MNDVISVIYGTLQMVVRMRETGHGDTEIINAIGSMAKEMKPLVNADRAKQLDDMFDSLLKDFKAGKGEFAPEGSKAAEGKKLFG